MSGQALSQGLVISCMRWNFNDISCARQDGAALHFLLHKPFCRVYGAVSPSGASRVYPGKMNDKL